MDEQDELDFNGIDEDLEQFQQDDIVRQALLQGVDLRGYARDIDLELREVELDSVQEYGAQNGEVVALHKQIQGCDAILARMQEMLLGFQADLGGISDEIKHLQDESISMNIKLKNLRSAEEDLGRFLGNVVVTSELATSICGDEVSDVYLEYVIELNNKIKYLGQSQAAPDGSSLDMPPSRTMAAKGVQPHLENLKAKVCSKARDYLLQKIGELRKPKTNVQIIQKNSLLKYKYLMQFMCDNAPEVAEEIRTVYIESMGRTIAALFRAYHAQLMKLELSTAGRHDVIAVEDAAARSLFSTKVDANKRDGFNMGDRDSILDAVKAGPILVHVALAEGRQFPYEAIMRSVFKHLMDSATSEYLFTIEFFKRQGRIMDYLHRVMRVQVFHLLPPARSKRIFVQFLIFGPTVMLRYKGQSHDTFNQIFGRTLSLCIENLENYLSTCCDCIGLLLMIKITHAHSMVMQRRRIPILDNFFDRVNMLLWPRFKTVFDNNLRSVKAANPKRLGAIERHPHHLTRRYAHFAASLLALHSGLDDFVVGIGGEEMLLNDLATLRVEVVQLVQRMAEQLPSNKLQVVFLINNYHEVLSVFQERRIISDETARFEELLLRQRDFFAEEELKEKYRRLISFVQQTESAMSSREAGAELDEAAVQGLVREFAASWKNGIEAINQDVLTFFSNARNAMEILKQVLTQLLLYYTRFQEIIRKSWRRPPPFSKDLVSTSAILKEIKNYSRSY